MASKIRNMVMSFAIMFTLVILTLNFWTPFSEQYEITETELVDDKNVFQKLKEITLVQALEDLTSGLRQVTKLSSAADLLGGIALIGNGILQTIAGIIAFPLQIFGILTDFYSLAIPEAIAQMIGFIVVLGISFILLSAKLGFDL